MQRDIIGSYVLPIFVVITLMSGVILFLRALFRMLPSFVAAATSDPLAALFTFAAFCSAIAFGIALRD